ncbi:MAG: RagB/SusD family nutrient uptake outer membrane protein [Reichenbachiella sp.]
MNDYKIYKTILFSLAFVFGCSDDFLDEQNPNKITQTSFWQSEADFQSGLIATYSALQYEATGGGQMSQYENIRSDIGRSFDFYGTYAHHQLNWNQSTPYVNAKWQELYIGVNRANQVIQYLGDFPAQGDFTQESHDRIMGQARFLRATFYFWIANSFGGAVIHTSIPESAEELKGEFQERQTVIDEVVKPDLRYAMSVLPTTWSGNENLGRITWGAAASMLGKVHLYDVRPTSSAGTEAFDSAAYYFREVINSGLYSLTPDIGDNFTSLNEFNEESIFEISFNDTFNPGVPMASKEDVGTTMGGETTGKAKQAAPQLKGGWRTVVPTHWVNELYESDEIDPAFAANAGNNYSLRAYWSIAFLRQDDGPLDGNYYQKDGNGDLRELADWFNGGAESVYWKKGTHWYEAVSEDGFSRSGINARMIRLADVYLMYAEAVLSGSSPDLNEALTYVDLVRERAGVIKLADYASANGRIPQFHKRGSSLGNYPQATLNAASLLSHIQMVERVLEVSFEGQGIRWNDLVRWGLVREAFENQDDHKYMELDPDSGEMVSNGYLEFCGESCIELEKLADATIRYASATVQLERYSPDTHDYYPIPESEFLNNNNL